MLVFASASLSLDLPPPPFRKRMSALKSV